MRNPSEQFNTVEAFPLNCRRTLTDRPCRFLTNLDPGQVLSLGEKMNELRSGTRCTALSGHTRLDLLHVHKPGRWTLNQARWMRWSKLEKDGKPISLGKANDVRR